MVDSIKEDLEQYIISTTEVKEYTSSYMVIGGYEDEERRKEVNSNFDTFNYNNTIMFDQIDNYNGTAEDIEKAQELSSKTWMRVIGGTYTIEAVPNPDTEYEYDDEGELVAIIYHKPDAYNDQNIVLAKIPAFSLHITTTATALEITLADHSVLSVETRDIGSEIPLLQYMDDEIAHGATIKIEFTVRIQNNSGLRYTM